MHFNAFPIPSTFIYNFATDDFDVWFFREPKSLLKLCEKAKSWTVCFIYHNLNYSLFKLERTRKENYKLWICEMIINF